MESRYIIVNFSVIWQKSRQGISSSSDRKVSMKFIGSRRSMLLGAVGVVLLAGYGAVKMSGQPKSKYVSPSGYIAGTVQGEKGPEAGVWVIAETKDLPTNFIKIVVTDDRGRYALPELPSASYKVWVRGYGLEDSSPVDAKPGATQLALKVTSARTPQEAAKVYPGDYWLSLLQPPPKNLFPGTGPDGNGVGTRMRTQDYWINSLKSDCNFCHQLGNALTRDTKHVFAAKPELKTDKEAWEWRLGVGVRGTNMYSVLTTQGKRRRGRLASSAISSSRCGMWATTTPSCTTRSRPTSGIRRLMVAATITPSMPVTVSWLC
jgi:hypothetical protein